MYTRYDRIGSTSATPSTSLRTNCKSRWWDQSDRCASRFPAFIFTKKDSSTIMSPSFNDAEVERVKSFSSHKESVGRGDIESLDQVNSCIFAVSIILLWGDHKLGISFICHYSFFPILLSALSGPNSHDFVQPRQNQDNSLHLWNQIMKNRFYFFQGRGLISFFTSFVI